MAEDSFDEYKYQEKDKDSIYLFKNYQNKKNSNEDNDLVRSEDNTSDDEEIKIKDNKILDMKDQPYLYINL